MQKEFKFRTLDKVRVKGKENSVTIYEVLHPSHPLFHADQDLKNYEISFQNYLDQKFSEAILILEKLTHIHPEDKSFKRMLEVCQDFLEVPPPPGWDGAYTHKSK